MNVSDVALRIENLQVHYKVYRGILKVLDGIDLEVRRGEKIGLVGETGCGKTTTLKAVMGILARNAIVVAGKIRANDDTVLEVKEGRVRKKLPKGVAMVFQDPTAALNPVFTVGEQLELVIKYAANINENTREFAIKALQSARLPDPERLLSNFPFQLSGGMRQRVCIGMALAARPSIILADEPTTNLDVTIQDQVLKLIKRLSDEQKLALVLVTHSLGVARETCDRIYVMYAGTIVEVADSKEIFEQPLHPYTKGLLASLPRLTGEGMAEGIKGRIPDYLNPPSGCRFAPRCDHAFEKCFVEKPFFHKVSDSHLVACFLYEKELKGKSGEQP
ncbi:MAG: D,D-dipeptide ABC transport system ATP-binding protein DppD [Thermotoga sp. 50_1627]|nr:MAG: D,D-dipeptide ABC transport system ATP-binding protein DppD [Thermotoga sp. 50_64]KUK24615.1 MAG: D,D-dipeptide ABC transport system ATP-binding protein DppD [Thermotoga sp. 50_1627]